MSHCFTFSSEESLVPERSGPTSLRGSGFRVSGGGMISVTSGISDDARTKQGGDVEDVWMDDDEGEDADNEDVDMEGDEESDNDDDEEEE